MIIALMRHGEAEDDIEDCYGGMADFVLTDIGREQASKVASLLTELSPERIFTSPLRRASETAEIISSTLGIGAPITIEELQERNSYGVLSGLSKDKAEKIFPSIFEKLKEKPGYSDEPIPGYEAWDDFVQRVTKGFNRVVAESKKSSYECIGIVTHGKFTQALLKDVLNIEKDIDLKLSALNILDYSPVVASIRD